MSTCRVRCQRSEQMLAVQEVHQGTEQDPGGHGAVRRWEPLQEGRACRLSCVRMTWPSSHLAELSQAGFHSSENIGKSRTRVWGP